MAGEHYYISDLHLAPHTVGTNALFDFFIENYAHQAASLTINGDLFNFYYGFKQLKSKFYYNLCYKIREVVRSGVRVDFIAGNRDFLFTEDSFSFGMRGYMEEVYRSLPHEKVSVTHGDNLCTEDRSYQRYRRIMRRLPLRKANYITPAFVGSMIARSLRLVSKLTHKKNRGLHESVPEQFDIQDVAVINFVRRHGCNTLICGHIHRPQERHYMLRGRDTRMLVLGDWKPDGAVIARAEADGPIQLVKLTPEGIEPWPHEIQKFEVERTEEPHRR